MNVIEALKQKRNLRRPGLMPTKTDGWLDYTYVLEALSGKYYGVILSEIDVMAEDWEVQSSAGERLQARIHQMEMETGKTPNVLDVSEEDFREIESDCYRRGIPDKARGLYQQLVVYFGSKGETRIVKARK